jgi:protein-L-isoaspartate(D-aspartate) O-methyltransferase
MLAVAKIGSGDRVLDVGSGTGYGTAIMARLARQVTGVEDNRDFVAQARARLAELGVLHAEIVEGKLTDGHRAGAPYDVIVIEGAVAAIPDAIADQLAEGGRLLAVVKAGGAVGRAMLMTRADGVLSRRPLFDAACPMLPGFEAAPRFVF